MHRQEQELAPSAFHEYSTYLRQKIIDVILVTTGQDKLFFFLMMLAFSRKVFKRSLTHWANVCTTNVGFLSAIVRFRLMFDHLCVDNLQ